MKQKRVAPTLSEEEFVAITAMASEIGVKPTWLARRFIQIMIARYVSAPVQLRLDLNLPEMGKLKLEN